MQLTRFTDLGLRILMHLATPAGASGETTTAVADQVAASPTHAAKVVTRLQNLGLVETRRGRSGGLAITPAGRTTSVGWIARQLEGPGEVINCEGERPCPLARGCRLRGLVREAQEAFFTVLDPWTIDDLAVAPTQDVLLQIGVGAPLDPTIPRSTGPN